MIATQSTALRETTQHGERVIAISPILTLVASQSEPGTWHAVELLNGRPHCDCKSFAYRGRCRHLEAVAPEITPAEVSERLLDYVCGKAPKPSARQVLAAAFA